MLRIHLIILILSVTSAQAVSINPERTVTPFLEIFSTRNHTSEDGKIQVQVTTYTQNGNLRRGGGTTLIEPSEYEYFRSQAAAVYEVTPFVLPGATKPTHLGTAFHIGHNLLLTNAHVLDRNYQNLRHCGTFRIKNRKGDYLGCQKVHFCDQHLDVCLIEMYSQRNSWLAQGQALRLRARGLSFESGFDQNDKVLSAIGNSMGFGIHFSQGRGYNIQGPNVRFYAPIRSGNSGGALLDAEGRVVGIVKQESKSVKVGPTAYNIALSSESAIEAIRSALRNDPATLEKFNDSVLE